MAAHRAHPTRQASATGRRARLVVMLAIAVLAGTSPSHAAGSNALSDSPALNQYIPSVAAAEGPVATAPAAIATPTAAALPAAAARAVAGLAPEERDRLRSLALNPRFGAPQRRADAHPPRAVSAVRVTLVGAVGNVLRDAPALALLLAVVICALVASAFVRRARGGRT